MTDAKKAGSIELMINQRKAGAGHMMRLIDKQGADERNFEEGIRGKVSRARERAGRSDKKDWGALMN